MGLSRLNLIIGIFLVIFSILYGWIYLFEPYDSSSYTIDIKYFGPTIPLANNDEDLSIKTFKIPYEHSQIEDLIDRLNRTRFYEAQILRDNRNVNQSTYGFNRKTAEIIREYWINTYNWNKTVEELNTFNHYKTFISGLNIHFVRVTNNFQISNKKKQAILLLHGWPSTFIEYLDVARLLNSSINSTYDIIIPSLPGFGYSDAPLQSGMNAQQIAHLMDILMKRIGYNSYVICGGDWGSIIGTYMAQLYPNHVRGLLITLVTSDTIGYALNDSPIGLATYILEKWSRWSNNQTEIDHSINSGLDRFTFDQLISNVMIYWTTGSITSSMRIYFEQISSIISDDNNNNKLLNDPVLKLIPIAIVNYRYEVSYIPRILAKTKYPNITLWLYYNQGGHFASIGRPNEYSYDIEKFLLHL